MPPSIDSKTRVHFTGPIGESASATHDPIKGDSTPSFPRPFFQIVFCVCMILKSFE
jgi:hypothetical protein